MDYNVIKTVGSGERGFRLGSEVNSSGITDDLTSMIHFAYMKSKSKDCEWAETGRNSTDDTGYLGQVAPAGDLGTTEHILKFATETYVGDRVLNSPNAEADDNWIYKASQSGFYYFKCHVNIELTTGWDLLDYSTYFPDDVIWLKQYKNGSVFGLSDKKPVYLTYVQTASPPVSKTTLGQHYFWELEVENIIYLQANDTTDFRVNLTTQILVNPISFRIKGYVNHFLYALPEMKAAVIP